MNPCKDIALGSIKTATADLVGNSNKLLTLCQQAKEQGKKWVFFPELAITGTDCQDLFLNKAFKVKANQALLNFVAQIPDDLTVGVGTALADTFGDVFDAYVFAKRGKIEAIYCARGFTRGPMEYRGRYFAPAEGEHAVFDLNGKAYHDCKNGIELDGLKLAVVFDANFDKKFKKADIAIFPSARVYETYAIQAAADALTDLSARSKALLVAPNLCGNESGGAILDGVCMMARKGELLVKSKACFFADEKLVTVADGVVPADDYYDEMLRAVALGVDDFMYNSKGHGFALSLSGGADSALCATSVALSQILALNELGAKAYANRVANVGFNFPQCEGDIVSYVKEVVMPQMLVTVYQGSDNSSDITRNAARQVATGLGASHHEWSISKVVQDYVDLFNGISDKPLAWETDDVPLQNIQARSRLPGIWLAANRDGRLLIETSNLSESAVGYCTMDGDTAGGLAPIAGIGKSVVRRINKHLETVGFKVDDKLTFKLPQMSYITAQAPTAELRPGGTQTDEGDLMPYVVLDEIRKLFSQDYLGPVEILERLQQDEQFKEYGEKLPEYVRRFFVMHSRSQWKRIRYPVGFHIEKDDESPCGYWRFPIFSQDLKVLTEDLK